MKNFLLAAAKLATGLFLAGLALGITIALYFWATKIYESSQAKQYETIKEWPADLTANLGLQLQAKTKVISGKLLLSVDIVGYPAYLSDPRLAERNQKAQLIVQFVDLDGFRVFSKPIELSEFSGIVGAKGEKIGLRTQLQEYVSIEDYKRFQRLQVEWTLETKVPPNLAPDVKEEQSRLDHCAPSISRAERLKRLSKHGELREIASGSYSAGDRSVHFFYDGTLLNCR
ncbi:MULTISPECIES: hypothetical protein [Gammaproteobacteria]|uniref:hypothetical protein n=1 Tax=Gammaproteobacteria TaxID=1236 RepID=UPI0019121765|nr:MULTISPECIES: hypothetical protein [Gammaproteobacteria]MBK5299705.1 hypothetical protein [Bacillus sp. TH86]MBK5319474.1 hypothetical protein [Bacillus sp. TH59]MBK5334424.1 hypothetical protein [Bacillus sp. TH57]MBK5308514.1 hypothetical protein [Pseudomonas sp. TH71]MBK5313973.1 hypothetical protein [Erwinia sp. TH79]